MSEPTWMKTAERIEVIYAPEVRIVAYRSGKVILHYRDREGDWLHDPLVDTDFTGRRRWKEFDSIEAAYAYLEGLYE